MAQEQGLVASVRDDGWAKVVTDRKDACGDCGASNCCASFGSNSKMVIKAMNRAGAGVGDLVSLTINTPAAIKSAAIVYLVPLAGLILGLILGVSLDEKLHIDETNASIGFGLAGLFLGFLIVILVSRWMAARHGLTPVISRVIKRGLPDSKTAIAIDPVCDMVVNPPDAAATVNYRDKTYYFCHPNCRASFVKDPEKYLNPTRRH